MKNCGREVKYIEFVGYFIFSYYLCHIYWSLKHCRIKKGKETRSFLKSFTLIYIIYSAFY